MEFHLYSIDTGEIVLYRLVNVKGNQIIFSELIKSCSFEHLTDWQSNPAISNPWSIMIDGNAWFLSNDLNFVKIFDSHFFPFFNWRLKNLHNAPPRQNLTITSYELGPDQELFAVPRYILNDAEEYIYKLVDDI